MRGIVALTWGLLLVGVASAAHDGEDGTQEAIGPSGGTRFVDDERGSLVPWIVGGALATVVGLVVASSASKPRSLRADPLVTLPSDSGSQAFSRGRHLAYSSPPSSLLLAFRGMTARGLGTPVLAATKPGLRIVEVANCVECRRSEVGCEAARGYLAASFEILSGREVDVVEEGCDAKRRVCRFRITVTG